MWQYTSEGKVSGIAGDVDLNHCYRDYPKEIEQESAEGGGTELSGPVGSVLDLTAMTLRENTETGMPEKQRWKPLPGCAEYDNHIASASVQTLAKETLEGKYGNGDTRKIVLGDRYDEVQKQINAESFSMEQWIRKLQEACNDQGFSHQTVDGIAGPDTLAGCPTVREGASGAITKLIQQRLISLGYSCGSAGADGKFGGDTKGAVRAFQKANGLAADGIVGKNTWKKLLGME